MPHFQKCTIFKKNAPFSKKCSIFKKYFIFTGPDLKQARRTGLSARSARSTKWRGQKGPQLEVGARRDLRLLVLYIATKLPQGTFNPATNGWCGEHGESLGVGLGGWLRTMRLSRSAIARPSYWHATGTDGGAHLQIWGFRVEELMLLTQIWSAHCWHRRLVISKPHNGKSASALCWSLAIIQINRTNYSGAWEQGRGKQMTTDTPRDTCRPHSHVSSTPWELCVFLCVWRICE